MKSLETYIKNVRKKAGLSDMNVRIGEKAGTLLKNRVEEYGDDVVADVIDAAAKDGNYGQASAFNLSFLLCDNVFQQLLMLRGNQKRINSGWEIPDHMKPDVAEWQRSYHERLQEAGAV